MKTKEMLTLEQNLSRNHLFNTFVLLPMIEQSDMIQNIEVEVYHEIIFTIKTIIHTLDIVLHLKIDLVMTKIPLSLLIHTTKIRQL